MSEVTNTSTLREALRRCEGLLAVIASPNRVTYEQPGEAALMVSEVMAEIREVLAAAPEPEWEYRVALRGGHAGTHAHGFATLAAAEKCLQDRHPCWTSGHIERRVPAGPWERTESHEGASHVE